MGLQVDQWMHSSAKKNGVRSLTVHELQVVFIGLLVMVYEIIPISLSSFHPFVLHETKRFAHFFVAQMVMVCCYQVRRLINN